MDEAALERAKRRISQAAKGRPSPADIGASLERSRAQIEALAATAAELEAAIPVQVGDAVRDGLRAEVLPVARHIAEMRGLFNQAIRRLERIEGELLAERAARVDDLALLVELVSSGWRGVDARLARLEHESAETAAPLRSAVDDGPAQEARTQDSPGDSPGQSSPGPGFPGQGRHAEAIVERAGITEATVEEVGVEQAAA
jgi:hypothetical protein